MTIALKPEIEAALAAQANLRGVTPDQLANEILNDGLRELNGAGPERVNGADAGKDESAKEPLADFLKGYIGVVDGSAEPLSLNCGERFTEYVVRKHREGKL